MSRKKCWYCGEKKKLTGLNGMHTTNNYKCPNAPHIKDIIKDVIKKFK